MTPAKVKPTEIEVGPDLWTVKVRWTDLKEQDVNAQVMPPREFERLTENVRRRGALEGMVYCAQPNGEGPIEIVSGHHRVRAAVAAGLDSGWVLVDRRPMTRSEIVSKQLAHNALVGDSDPDVRQSLIGMIDNPDDLLATGLPDDVLGGGDERDAVDLFAPRVDFDYRTVSFAFLDHEKREFDDLLESFSQKQDMGGLLPVGAVRRSAQGGGPVRAGQGHSLGRDRDLAADPHGPRGGRAS